MARPTLFPFVAGEDASGYTVRMGERVETGLSPPCRIGPWLVLDVMQGEEGAYACCCVGRAGDLFAAGLVMSSDGQMVDVQAKLTWAPTLYPRPDMAETARAWLEALDDPLAAEAKKALQRDPSSLLELMPPLIGQGFIAFPLPVTEPILVQADGRTDNLPPLPIPPGAPRWYAATGGLVPLLVIGWGEDDENLAIFVQHETGKLCRLVWQGGRAIVEPEDADFTPADFRYCVVSAVFSSDLLGVQLGNQRLQAAVEHCAYLGLHTFRGALPKYGVGEYSEPRHDSFPPAITYMVECLWSWGQTELAEQLLAAYLARYVRDDGTVDYYGMSVSELGQLVHIAGLFAGWPQHAAFCARYAGLIGALARRAARMLREAVQRDEVVRGLPEADFWQDEGASERPYLSGHLWLFRGLRTYMLAVGSSSPAQDASIDDIAAELVDYAGDLVSRSEQDGDFVPAISGSQQVFRRMTESREASYTNYRFWPEMLSSGIVPKKLAEAIVRWRQTHGGELMGMTRFANWLDDWPVWHYAQGLLRLGRQVEYTLLMWAHLLHHQMPGWWVAYEQVDVVPDEHGWRRPKAGQVVPSQLTVPLMLRAGLLWEDPDRGELLVLPAGRVFLRSIGERAQLPVVMTSFGPADLSIELDRIGLHGTLRIGCVDTSSAPLIVLPRQCKVVEVYQESLEPFMTTADLVAANPYLAMMQWDAADEAFASPLFWLARYRWLWEEDEREEYESALDRMRFLLENHDEVQRIGREPLEWRQNGRRVEIKGALDAPARVTVAFEPRGVNAP